MSYDIKFGDVTVKSRMYDIDVVGYEKGLNKLHLFDLESVDEGIVKKGIDFEMYNLETAKKELEALVREYPKYAQDIIDIVGEYE